MIKMTILLNDFSKIKYFNNIVSSFISDIDIVKGRYVIDAKSTMGIFTLDLSQPVDVIIHSEDDEEITRFYETMKEFEV